MQAVSCTTIEQDDSWTTYLTDNDRVFFDTIKDCGAEGVFHFCTKFDVFDMRTVDSSALTKSIPNCSAL